MEEVTEDLVLRSFDDEPMVMGRNTPSVSCLGPTLFPHLSSSSASAIIHGFQDQLQDVRRFYDDYGPTPRLCIDYLESEDELNDFKARRGKEIMNFSLKSLLQFTQQTDITLDVSHSVFLVRRQKVDNLQGYIVEPITDSVGLLLRLKLMEAEWREQIQAYRKLAKAPGDRAWAGPVFESMAQLQLQKEVALDLVPMTRQQGSGNRLPKWISSSRAPNAGDAANTPTPIKFKPKDIVRYDTLEAIHPDVLYVPNAPNQVGFDSFILHDAILFMFQMTTSPEHPIKLGIMDFLSHETLKKAQGHFIFVVPPGGTTECRESTDERFKEFWEKAGVVPLFTAEFDPEKIHRP